MVPLRARRKTLLILAIAFLAAVAAAMLPDDPYQRWQLLDGTIQKNARWIYERTNFDPDPDRRGHPWPLPLGGGRRQP